ncbi:MAG: B12-binding domain-containing radical SAM protein [Planctomycetes bacterium]|nr:B12-binding domain-containing radical SAM protein [Planctomycetota bacterium]
MRINIVSVEDSLISLGVRKVSAYVRRINPDTKIFYVPLTKFFSLWSALRPRYSDELDPQRDLPPMAEAIADADIVAFSSMSHVAEQTKMLIREVRRINPKAYVIWGGIHPIIVPEDAILDVDAVCTGEGEFAFEQFLDAFSNGRDFTGTPNFWFNRSGKIIKNDFLPLMTSAEMETLPPPVYGNDESIYDSKARRYRAITRDDYLRFMGLTYYTIWTIGCPFKCTFCANTKFIENDRSYTKLRFPSAKWIVNEINRARRVHPHLSGVCFVDDSLMALPTKVLEEFAAVYKTEVGLPFFVPGVIPNYVKKEKVEILLEAGMTEVRMGIQSGSRRILDFYKRPAPPERVLAAIETFAEYKKYLIPPAYDFIQDNPIETREDILDTLELVYKMPRPFTLNLFSLRVQPNTTMAEQFEKLDIRPGDLASESYKTLRPTFANCLIVLLTLVKPPRKVFDRMLRHVRGVSDPQKLHPWLFYTLHTLYLIRRGFSHLRFMDFSRMPGRTAWILWRLGIVGFWHRRMVPRFQRKASHTGTPAPQPVREPIFIALPILPGSGSLQVA